MISFTAELVMWYILNLISHMSFDKLRGEPGFEPPVLSTLESIGRTTMLPRLYWRIIDPFFYVYYIIF